MVVTHDSSSSPLGIVSAMIAPALLIVATGNLVSSTLVRLNRVVDRARVLIARIAELHAAGDRDAATVHAQWLRNYQRRSLLAQRALQCYYFALFLLVAGSLAIALDNVTHGAAPWPAVALVIGGAICLTLGTLALVIETNVATGQLRHEIETSGAMGRPGRPNRDAPRESTWPRVPRPLGCDR